MKSYFKFIILSLVLIGVSCDEQLDRSPVDQLTPETAFQSVQDLQFGLSGVIGSYAPNAIVAHNSIFTDNCKVGVDSGGQELNALQQVLNADQGDRGLWASRYGIINDVNRLIVAAEGITPESGEEDQYDFILAQAYSFRALLHWEVLLYYGLDIRDNTAPGVPYVDYVSLNATPPRNTTAEVLAGIQGDLDQALALFPVGTNDIDFATPDFVTFLRARIALETEANLAAIALASDIIADYPLATPNEYFNMFREDANKVEVIWNYDSVQGANLGLNFTWNFTGQGPFVEVSNELGGLLQPADIRTQVILDPLSVPADNLFIVGKYPENADTQAINDYKAMRVSEMYLVRAEAYAKEGNFDAAEDDVNAIRSIRGLVADANYANLNEALLGILAERRLELAFEGHRYTDIKRLRGILNIGIERIPSDCEGFIPCSLAPTSEKWVFPIPTAEINGNPNMTQNPDY